MDLLAIMHEKRFLGQEFLTWLWWISEDEAQVNLPDGRQVEILLGDRLVLGPIMGQEGARVTVRGREVSLAEARQALRRGKLVEGLRLGLIIDGEEFWLGLNAAELAIGGLKTPASAPAEGGPEGRDALTLERIALIDTVVRALEGLYRRYLEDRLDTAACADEWERMRAWAASQA